MIRSEAGPELIMRISSILGRLQIKPFFEIKILLEAWMWIRISVTSKISTSSTSLTKRGSTWAISKTFQFSAKKATTTANSAGDVKMDIQGTLGLVGSSTLS